MTTEPQRLAVWVLVGTVLGTGCASRQPHSSPFLRHGTGYVDVGGAPTEPSEKLEKALETARREALASRAAAAPASVPSIERLDPALRDALAALASRPSAEAHIHVAHAYTKVGVADAAFDHYSEAIELDDESASAYEGRARLWRDWGFITMALGDIHRARHYAPEVPQILNTLGTILERANDCHGAREAYGTALARDPAAGYARRNLERLLCPPLVPGLVKPARRMTNDE